MQQRDAPAVMNVAEAARYIRVSQKAVRDMARDGRMPAQKVGREWRFLKAALDDWLAGARRVAEESPAYGKTRQKGRRRR